MSSATSTKRISSCAADPSKACSALMLHLEKMVAVISNKAFTEHLQLLFRTFSSTTYQASKLAMDASSSSQNISQIVGSHLSRAVQKNGQLLQR
jgi:hypothetical protein